MGISFRRLVSRECIPTVPGTMAGLAPLKSRMLLAAPLPPTPPALIGPPAPAIPGLVPGSAAFSATKSGRLALREMPGAVVVVEDEALRIDLVADPGLRFGRHRLRMFGSAELPVFPFTPSMPVWMNPSVLVSGGNVVHKVFSFGGGSF